MNNQAKAHPKEQAIKAIFIGECWTYLRSNFSKFKQATQIKIALELCKRDIPQEVTGDFKHKIIELATIHKEIPSDEPNAGPVNRIAEYLIGSPASPLDTERTE